MENSGMMKAGCGSGPGSDPVFVRIVQSVQILSFKNPESKGSGSLQERVQTGSFLASYRVISGICQLSPPEMLWRSCECSEY